MISSSGRFVIRSFRAISGVAAWATASAASIAKCSSGMGRLSDIHAPGRQFAEEPVNLLPDLRPAREPAPVHADQSHQPIALIDGHNEIHGWHRNPVYQERLHILLHRLKRWMLGRDLLPRFE